MEVSSPPRPLPSLYGDPGRVQQAVAELIKNAGTFAAEAGEIRVTVSNQANQGSSFTLWLPAATDR